MTMTDTFAEALIAARRTGLRADAGALASPDYDAALQIQRRVQAQIGAVGGFKVGARPEGPPTLAPIPAARILPSGAEVTVRDRMGIELEIGFELIAEPGEDPMRDPAAVFRPRIVLELVDTRLNGGNDDPMMKLADMLLNDGLILGPALTDWDGEDFGHVTAALTCGDRQVIDGTVEVPGGSALANLRLLCAHLGDHCGGLQKGQIVITGSLPGLPYFPAGTQVSGRIDGLGEISCSLV